MSTRKATVAKKPRKKSTQKKYPRRYYKPANSSAMNMAYKAGKNEALASCMKKEGMKKASSSGWWSSLPAIGGAIGSYIAPGIGDVIGYGAGSLMASIAGHGGYTVNRNSVIFPDQVPLFSTKQDGCIRMRHREFLCDIVTNSNAGIFQVQSFPIDVSNPNTFPMLSQIAANFEEWRMEGLVFEYKTTSGSISSTGQLGCAILATQYNSNALPFQNKQQMEAYTFASSTVVSASVIHPVECDPKQTPSNGLFYSQVPGTTSSANADLRWSQLGIFNIATQGCAASENIGELWVSYDCYLCKPRLISAVAQNAAHYQLGAGITTSAYFGTVPVLTQGSDAGFVTLTATQINISSSFNGIIGVYYELAGSAGAWVEPTFSITSSTSSVYNILGNNTTSGRTITYGAAATAIAKVQYFKVVADVTAGFPAGVGAQITFSSGTFFSPTVGDLIVFQLPSDFN